MSELIEKVARALYPTWWETVDKCPDGADCESCSGDRAHSLGKARAAIAAVAEWLDDALKDDDGRIYVPQFLRAAAGSAPTPPEVK